MICNTEGAVYCLREFYNLIIFFKKKLVITSILDFKNASHMTRNMLKSRLFSLYRFIVCKTHIDKCNSGNMLIVRIAFKRMQSFFFSDICSGSRLKTTASSLKLPRFYVISPGCSRDDSFKEIYYLFCKNVVTMWRQEKVQ